MGGPDRRHYTCRVSRVALNRLWLGLLALLLASCSARVATPASATPAIAAQATLTPLGFDVPLFPGIPWTGPIPALDSATVVALPARQWESAFNIDLKAADVGAYYRREFGRLGFVSGPEAGGDTNFGMVAAREDVAITVNFWQGEKPASPPVRPELGFKIRLVAGGPTDAAWALAGVASPGPQFFGKLPADPPAPPTALSLQGAQMSGALPALPDSAAVYRLRAPDFSDGGARLFAGALGYKGDPVAAAGRKDLGGAGPFLSFGWGSGASQLLVWPVASAFRATEPADHPEPLAGDSALSAARNFARSRGLIASDLALEEAAPVTGGLSVRFQRLLEGRPVLGLLGSGLSFTYRANSPPVWQVQSIHRPLEARSLYPLRRVEQAWAEVQAGRYQYLETASPPTAPVNLGTVTITRIELAYHEAGADQYQAYLTPMFVFHGQSDKLAGEITIYAAAVADSWRGG